VPRKDENQHCKREKGGQFKLKDSGEEARSAWFFNPFITIKGKITFKSSLYSEWGRTSLQKAPQIGNSR